MERIFYKIPTTIGEELEAQIKYCKSIGRIKNNSDLSLKMRELEKEIFGEERKYAIGEENVRPATITELYKITVNQEISNYFLLYSSFKSLNIIKEEHNIIELFDYYGIAPKKKVDKERLKELREEYKIIKREKCVKFCFGCPEKISKYCNNANKCLYIKIRKNLRNMITTDEQIKYLYTLGFPSCFEKMNTINNQGDYRLPISSLKIILKELGEIEKLDFINKLEKRYLVKFNKTEQVRKQKMKEIEDKIKKQKEEIKQFKIKDSNNLNEVHKLQYKQSQYEINKNIIENKKKKYKDKDYEEMLFIIYKKCVFNQVINDKDETFESILEKESIYKKN